MLGRAAVAAESPTNDHLYVSHRFDDFDAYTAAMAGWDLRFRQLDRGSFEGEMTQIVSGPVRLTEGRVSRKLEHFGAAPPGHWTFGVPAIRNMSYRWRDQTVEGNQIIGFNPETEMESVTEAGFHLFAISVAEEAVARICEETGLPLLEESIGQRATATLAGRPALALREALGDLMAESRRDPTLLSEPAMQRRVQESLPALIVELFSASSDLSRRDYPEVRGRALRRALSVIADRADEPLGIAELYRLSGASGRTLRYAFEEAYGMSPKAYLQAYRLNGVRRILGGADPAVKGIIADTANTWGFWHLGQFAADYKRLFGELPSETLARVR